MNLARCLALFALAASMGAAAQEADDRARLEDFALPDAPQSSRIEQLSPDAAPVVRADRKADRSIVTPPRGAAESEAPGQLSKTKDSRSPEQLSGTDDQERTQTASVSSTADSNPGGVVRLRGRDKCDPQLGKEQLAECMRILELRADEFNAPAPPQLTVEQKLLAEQREREDRLADRSAALRLRYATANDPDADLASNQELASIYLGLPNAPVAAPNPEEPEQPAADVGEILNVLGLGDYTPPQN